MFKTDLSDVVFAVFAVLCGISIGINLAELITKICS
jgi:hypothetical protein